MEGTQMNTSLTDRQREVYLFMVQHLLLHQRLPTYREIGKAIGMASPNGVLCHLTALERKGLLWPGRHMALAGVHLCLRFEDSEAGRAARAILEEADERGAFGRLAL